MKPPSNILWLFHSLPLRNGDFGMVKKDNRHRQPWLSPSNIGGKPANVPLKTNPMKMTRG
jgi:hypothetical protein